MPETKDRLRKIPSIDKLIQFAKTDSRFFQYPLPLWTEELRKAVGVVRQQVLRGEEADCSKGCVWQMALDRLEERLTPKLRKVINATGVVLHTNLGRAPLSASAVQRVQEVMSGYSSLEYDIQSGKRGNRYSGIHDKLCALLNAEDVLAVNNNAAAVLLTLSTLAVGREVIVSRGQLVEIGGSFRIPDVMALSGARLVEVGTTNKTHVSDYEQAIGPGTAAILKVHTSNYRIVGFASQPSDRELTDLAHAYGLPLIDDLGSGTLAPIETAGWHEPTVKERLSAGADVVLFSGDKLMGASQAGIVAGKGALIGNMRRHPLLRAVRIDKLSLAALEGTLMDYIQDASAERIPVHRMLRAAPEALREKAVQLQAWLADLIPRGWKIGVGPVESQAGGGSLPEVPFAGYGLFIRPGAITAAELERELRNFAVPIIARVSEEQVIIDVRCLSENDLLVIRDACLEIGRRERQS